MSAEQTVPTLDPAHALRHSLLVPERQRLPVFWLALIAAALAHAALVVGISHAPPHYLGDPSGNAEAIDVEIVDAGELRSMSSPQSAAAAPPSTPPAAQAAPPAQEPPRPEPEPTAQNAPEPPSKTPSETTDPQQSAALPALEAEKPEAAPPDALPKPAPPKESVKSESPAKKESAAKPTPKTAIKPPTNLDLSVPMDLTMQGAQSGGGAASTRPPGITRSGANDRFGRDVIRALKKTMPPSEGVTGKVKVRIFLNERGNVAWVRVVDSSGDRLLDDNVVFSVHQSLFPFPPKGATEADRTFLVTYIYR